MPNSSENHAKLVNSIGLDPSQDLSELEPRYAEWLSALIRRYMVDGSSQGQNWRSWQSDCVFFSRRSVSSHSEADLSDIYDAVLANLGPDSSARGGQRPFAAQLIQNPAECSVGQQQVIWIVRPHQVTGFREFFHQAKRSRSFGHDWELLNHGDARHEVRKVASQIVRALAKSTCIPLPPTISVILPEEKDSVGAFVKRMWDTARSAAVEPALSLQY